MRRPLMSVALLFVALLVGFAVYVDRRADRREAAIEARFPPGGQSVTVDGTEIHVIVKVKAPMSC